MVYDYGFHPFNRYSYPKIFNNCVFAYLYSLQIPVILTYFFVSELLKNFFPRKLKKIILKLKKNCKYIFRKQVLQPNIKKKVSIDPLFKIPIIVPDDDDLEPKSSPKW